MSLVRLNIKSRIELETRVLAAALKQSFEAGDGDGVNLAHRQLFLLLQEAGGSEDQGGVATIHLSDGVPAGLPVAEATKSEPTATAWADGTNTTEFDFASPDNALPVETAGGELGLPHGAMAASPGNAGNAVEDSATTVLASTPSNVPFSQSSAPQRTVLDRDVQAPDALASELYTRFVHQPNEPAEHNLPADLTSSSKAKFDPLAAKFAADPLFGAHQSDPTAENKILKNDETTAENLSLPSASEVAPAQVVGPEPFATLPPAPESESQAPKFKQGFMRHAARAQQSAPRSATMAAGQEAKGGNEIVPAQEKAEADAQPGSLQSTANNDYPGFDQAAEPTGGLPSRAAVPENVDRSGYRSAVETGEHQAANAQQRMNEAGYRPATETGEHAPAGAQQRINDAGYRPAVETGEHQPAKASAQYGEGSSTIEPPSGIAAVDETVAAQNLLTPYSASAELQQDALNMVAESERLKGRPSIYELLGVSQMSPFEQIHKHFLRRVRRVLREIKKNKALRHEKLAELQRLWIAHDILTDPVTRTDYDFRDLGVRGSPEVSAHPAEEQQSGLMMRIPLRIGELLQCTGLLEPAELEIACDMHKAMPEIQFGSFLVNQGFIQERDLESALVGQKLLREGAITVAQFQVAMELSQSRGSLINETLVEKGYITAEDLHLRMNPPPPEEVASPVVQIREVPIVPRPAQMRKTDDQRQGATWSDQLSWGTNDQSSSQPNSARQSLGGLLNNQQSAPETSKNFKPYGIDFSSPNPLVEPELPAMLERTDPSSAGSTSESDQNPNENVLPPQMEKSNASAVHTPAIQLGNTAPNWKDHLDWGSPDEDAEQAEPPDSEKISVAHGPGEVSERAGQNEPATKETVVDSATDEASAAIPTPFAGAEALISTVNTFSAVTSEDLPTIDVNNDMATAITADGAKFDLIAYSRLHRVPKSEPSLPPEEPSSLQEESSTQPVPLPAPSLTPSTLPAPSSTPATSQLTLPVQPSTALVTPSTPPAPSSASESSSSVSGMAVPGSGPGVKSNDDTKIQELAPPSSTTDDVAQEPVEALPGAGAKQSQAEAFPGNTAAVQHVEAPPASLFGSAMFDQSTTDVAMPFEGGFFSHLLGADEIFEGSSMPLSDAIIESDGETQPVAVEATPQTVGLGPEEEADAAGEIDEPAEGSEADRKGERKKKAKDRRKKRK